MIKEMLSDKQVSESWWDVVKGLVWFVILFIVINTF